MRWQLSHRADPLAAVIADRHYSRQTPGAPQFVPPGSCMVLRRSDAYWVTSWPFAEYVKHAWPGAWVCSAFRNEGVELSSELIREAVAATRWFYGDVPDLGMVTFVDAEKVRHKRDPGRCFLKAGFKRVGFTKGGLHALQLMPEDMPDATPPYAARLSLFDPNRINPDPAGADDTSEDGHPPASNGVWTPTGKPLRRVSAVIS